MGSVGDRDGNREGVVLPDTPGQGRKVQVSGSRCCHAKNVKADIILIDDGDCCCPNTIFRNANNPHQTIETPTTKCNDDPGLVAPLVTKGLDHMPVGGHQNDESGDDMPCYEDLVDFLSNGQDGCCEYYAHTNRGDDAPVPI